MPVTDISSSFNNVFNVLHPQGIFGKSLTFKVPNKSN